MPVKTRTQGRGFNSAAADTIYKAMAAMDEDTALVFGRILVADAVNYDLIAHRTGLAELGAEMVEKRAQTLRRHYTRTAVEKARAGRDTTHEISCLVQIGKALNFTTQQRREYAQGRHREHGRFVREHRHIDFDDSQAPITDKTAAESRGFPDPAASQLKGNDLAHFQQAYSQVQDMLAPFHNDDLNTLLHLRVYNTAGTARDEQVAVGSDKDLKNMASKLAAGDRIDSAAVSVAPDPKNVLNPAFDALAAAGAPGAAGYLSNAYSHGVLHTPRLERFNDQRVNNRTDNENFSSASRAFGRLERGSSILQDSLGPIAPPHLQYALAVANHVGQFGPEAQKVIGPAADRAAYRYRGTERELDPKLASAFTALRSTGRKGQDLRDAAISGTGPEDEWNPGPILRYFHRQLPDPDLNELQRRSGVIPPSEGIIVAPNGSVAHQSVGYADDWYLPFNLRHLSALRGGEYIRTRTFGGPSTEDIYTGLVSGAKSLTVVSHNGVFTIDFDRNLRGGRRFNDKAGRMVARYGQLLDAVRSKQVSRGGISPSRDAELRAEAKQFDPDESSTAFRTKLRELQTAQLQAPQLSAHERNVAATEWLGAQAARRTTNDGHTMTPAELTVDVINTEGKKRYRADVATAIAAGQRPALTEEQFRLQVRQELQKDNEVDRVGAIAALMGEGDSERFERAMTKASEDNAQKSRALKLDGVGYATALKALQEQFPYYITTHYTPWRDSMGIGLETARTREGASDTGYVAPRYNRPEKAEAGYFNDRVGQGKVEASSTRYQNYRVHQGKLKSAKSTGAADDDTTAIAATGTKSTTAAAIPKAGTPEATRAADLEMLDELFNKTHFATGATIAGVPAGGHLIRDEIKRPGFANIAPALHRLYSAGSPAELEMQLPDDELHDLLDQILNQAQGPEKLYAVKATTAHAFKNKGQVLPPATPPTTLGAMIREVDRDHAWKNAGIAYDQARPATTAAIEHAFSNESTIAPLVASGELLPIDHPDFEKKIEGVRLRLKTAEGDYARRAAMGTANPSVLQAHVRDAEGLLRATQLHRNWNKANAMEQAAAAAPTTGAGGNTTYSFIGLTPTQTQQVLNQLPSP